MAQQPAKRSGPEWLRDHHQQVAAKLIEQLERGAAPWTKPWKPGEQILPYNLQTGNAYRGGNSLLLSTPAAQRGYADERWATYKQIRRPAARCAKASTASACSSGAPRCRDEQGCPLKDPDGKPLYDQRPLERSQATSFVVFNAEQADGLPQRPMPAPAT